MSDFIAPLLGLAGDIFGSSSSRSRAEEANRYNRESYQNRIQWTVEDAKKAGVHPLFAMGMASQPSQAVVGQADAPDLKGAYESYKKSHSDRLAESESRSRTAANNAQAEYYRTMSGDIVQNQVNKSYEAMLKARAMSNPAGNVESEYAGMTMQSGAGDVPVGQLTPAQNWEDQYGGIVGEVAGMSNFMHDKWKQWLDKKSTQEFIRKYRLDKTAQEIYKEDFIPWYKEVFYK